MLCLLGLRFEQDEVTAAWVTDRPVVKERFLRCLANGMGGQTHDVAVFEKDERVGGLLRYGIPDFKLEKHIIDRRVRQIAAEGVEFQMGVDVGADISAHYLQKMFDCICLTMGAGQSRDLSVPGREYENILCYCRLY